LNVPGPDTEPDAELDAAWTDYELPLKRQSAAPESEIAAGGFWQGDTEEMLRNQAWFCALRWFAIAGLAVVAFLSTGVLGLAGFASLAGPAGPTGQPGRGFPWTSLQPAWPASAAAALLVLNLVYLALLRRASRRAHLPAATERGLWIQILVDLGVLTTVVHFLGSVGTFAPFMYLFHIVLACIFFPYGRSLLVAVAALGMYMVCLVLENTVPSGRPVPAPGALAGQWLSVAFVSGTVWFLASRLSNALRVRDRELLAVNHRLESSLEERTAHLLRTTHQLKAPFAAIHANTQLLLDGTCGSLPGPATTVIGQIAARCEMLSRGITAMLQLANLRSTAQAVPESIDVDLELVIRACVAAVQPWAARRAIGVDEDLRPARARVAPDHARLILENIISNAVTYSRDGQRVGVTLRPRPGAGAVVRVSDHGIGIAPAKLPRIFEDYYRTTEGARHNNASTGLGLAIVRESALASGVGVRVRSAPERGTEFAVTFP
jgi:two-component system phosphate regulon sensor histidine kinase PhoR